MSRASRLNSRLGTNDVVALRNLGGGFVALGDSIATGDEQATGGGGYGVAWPHMACAFSGQRLNYFGNAGVVGETSAQILARVPAVIALKPKIVHVMAGANDLTGGVTYATYQANMIAITTRLRAAGIRVVLNTILPRGNTTYLAEQLKWNSWLKWYANLNGYDIVDFFALLVDPATSMYASGYDSGDNVHPSQAAHLAMATHYASKILSNAYSPLMARCATDAQNLVANPLLTAGSPTPTAWGTSGSAAGGWAEGLVTDSDFLGKAWEVAYTGAAAGSFRAFSSTSPASGWAVGDQILVTFKVKTTVASGMPAPNGSNGFRAHVYRWSAGTIYYTPIVGSTVVHGVAQHSFKMTVPAGTTGLQIETLVFPNQAGANYTVRVGDFGLYNLTALGLT